MDYFKGSQNQRRTGLICLPVGIVSALLSLFIDSPLIFLLGNIVIITGIVLVVKSFITAHKEKVNEELKKKEAERLAKEAEEFEKRRAERIERKKAALENPIFFDTETTGLSESKDEILQLSIIDKDGNTLFSQYIKPTKRKTWKSAEAINGITPAMVKSCPTFDLYYNQIQDIFDNASLVVGYNTEFDMKFIRAAGIEYNGITADVMLDYQRIGHSDRYKKLVQCARYYGYKWDGDAHDALADTKATRHCFYEMIKRNDIDVWYLRKQ